MVEGMKVDTEWYRVKPTQGLKAKKNIHAVRAKL